MNLFTTIVIDFRLFLKKILIFLQMLISTSIGFNSLFLNGLNLDLSFLVKRICMKWEIMSVPVSVNLANHISPTLVESPKGMITRILNLQLQQLNPPKGNQNLSGSYYHKEPRHWKRVINLSTLGTFSPPTSISNIYPILNNRKSRTPPNTLS